ncbi:hypothetical protein A7C91_00380 [Thermococcus piezophilus]|uniref:DUF7343 domain-containing protein n=2 Tax=Thermococcus piezophilus TaxID=1712654 RepID=A0A172WEJ4_9EURY|nr:hypothetical protein A7C91_00380 [Thermococcus piezophilus]
MSTPENQKSRRRKSALIGLFMTLFILTAPLAGGQTYNYEINAYAVYFEVISPDDIKETIEIDLTSHTNLSQYVIYTDYPVDNPSAVMDFSGGVSPMNVTVREVLGGTNAIYLNFPTLKSGQSAKIRLSFTTRGMISEVDGKEQFTYYIKFSQPVGLFHMQLLIPKGYAILSPIIPSPDKVESSTNRLLLEWTRSNIRAGDEFYFIAGFSGEIKINQPSIWGYIGIFALGLLLGAGSVYGYVLYREKKREREREHLRSDEEKILAILREGPVLQSELAEKLGVSKAKVSIILREMEEKSLITRVKEGRTYRVYLRE